MVWPHPRDVILYARSSYYYYNVYLLHGVILLPDATSYDKRKNESVDCQTVDNHWKTKVANSRERISNSFGEKQY